jgi:photosystem II stability/assembly factor-like uncharacterized protein
MAVVRVVLGVAIVLFVGGERNDPALPRSIAFLDVRHGVLGTDRTIETTADGGRTWTIRYRGKGPFRVVSERGARRVWATAPRLYLRSDDRGARWRRLARRPVSGVEFGKPLVGWDVKERETFGENEAWLSKTRDGGRTWRRFRRVCRDQYGFGGLAHVAESHAWMTCVGQPGAGQQQRAVFETRDGGNSWTMRACGCQRPLTRGSITWAGYPRGLRFTPDGYGVMLQFRGSPILVSHDGGRTWRHGVGRPEVDLEVDASILSPKLIYALASEGHERARLLVSTDGGRDWRLVRRWAR